MRTCNYCKHNDFTSERVLFRSIINVETALGVIRVHGKKDIDKSINITVEQFLPEFNKENPNVEEVAQALCIPVSDIDLSIGPIQSVSTSRPKLIIPIKDPDVLNNLAPNYHELWSICDQYGTTGFYPFSIDKNDEELIVSSRQFPNRAGYNEDPATGVAASALGAYLTQHQVFRQFSDGWKTYQIKQGYAMNKPSMIVSEILVENGAITRTQIKGKAL
ncbi:PhzF family phenazine biosynthesis isomerase [Bacillus sp. JCM 19041]|uniref:PhzF family phenazine biosynthesis protein n=1 Tax=Bacillus sp. JCM 19041 TaxID=1460637 RepID=UPI0006D24129